MPVVRVGGPLCNRFILSSRFSSLQCERANGQRLPNVATMLEGGTPARRGTRLRAWGAWKAHELFAGVALAVLPRSCPVRPGCGVQRSEKT